MRAYHFFARGVGEDREPTVLWATSAIASRWSWTNCAADKWRVPPNCDGSAIIGVPPSIGSVMTTWTYPSDQSRFGGRWLSLLPR
jgi:hypothetical protein